MKSWEPGLKALKQMQQTHDYVKVTTYRGNGKARSRYAWVKKSQAATSAKL
jgi:hypothetical protein